MGLAAVADSSSDSGSSSSTPNDGESYAAGKFKDTAAAKSRQRQRRAIGLLEAPAAPQSMVVAARHAAESDAGDPDVGVISETVAIRESGHAPPEGVPGPGSAPPTRLDSPLLQVPICILNVGSS